MYADQFAFWLKQDNTKRLMIDAKEFVEWLCNKIADVSEKNLTLMNNSVSMIT